jgi:protein PhnA
MTTEIALQTRAEGKCELCGADEKLVAFEVPPASDGSVDQSVLMCGTCRDQVADPAKMDGAHWRCLNDSMWTPVPAVQVMAWRILNRLSSESWAQELLDMLYLDDETLAWAQASTDDAGNDDGAVTHLDSNGVVLQSGDTVTLIKDLNVKGAGFTAKRGTAVRGISLVPDNAGQIEGRINGQQIVILTAFVKK